MNDNFSDVDSVYLNQFAFLKSQIEKKIFLQLKEDAEEILNSNKKSLFNKSAGNIEKQYFLSKKSYKILTPIIARLGNEYFRISENDSKLEYDFEIKELWINFQKKYEYNPIHYHNYDLSFVIWVQIPYDLEKELECPNSKNSNIPLNSLFSFFYTDIFGKIKTAQIHVDKSYEGTVVVFSPHLQHMVYPFFTSDQYRISISGNVKKIDVKKSNTKSSFGYH